MEQDVRWKQRFDNFLRAFRNLKSAKELSAGRELSDLEKQGVKIGAKRNRKHADDDSDEEVYRTAKEIDAASGYHNHNEDQRMIFLSQH